MISSYMLKKNYTVQLDRNAYSITGFRRVRKIVIGNCQLRHVYVSVLLTV
jgi:hypothetical protein